MISKKVLSQKRVPTEIEEVLTSAVMGLQGVCSGICLQQGEEH